MRRSRRYVQFLGSLAHDERPLVYLFTGTDDFLKREALRKLSYLVLSPEARAVNYESFLAGDREWSEVEAACLSSGLFAEKRLVALIGVELMGSAEVSRFCEYVRRPCESTCLVAMTSSFSEESRRKGSVSLRRIVAALGEMPGFYEFWQGNMADCKAWAHDWLAENGKKMDENLLTQVVESYGSSSYEVWNTLEKVAGLLGDRDEITSEDVAFVGGAASIGSADAFRMAVAVADRVAAHGNAAKCLKAGIQPTTLLWRLNRSFRGALRSPRGSGGRDVNWMEKLAREALARRLKPEEICEAITLLCEAEKEIKGGRLRPELAVEVLINELTK
ncbi:MAG: hypothetical protein AMJ46_09560 [Latescibacteria bacterium DG_63]|nr:MAG: hypothetical protein AMJ46_09560 [Latescibacteria bacterium DG_63]